MNRRTVARASATILGSTDPIEDDEVADFLAHRVLTQDTHDVASSRGDQTTNPAAAATSACRAS
jgi:hypothetical protein